MSLALTLGVVIVGLVSTARFIVTTAEAHPAITPDDADAPECPGPYISIPVKGVERQGGPIVWMRRQTVEIAADISPVPEYHDCQRFIRKILVFGERYGPLYAVFAARELDQQTFMPNPNAGDDTTVAFVAAEVYTAKGNYGRLGIKPGFNCLYLSRANNWEGFMVSVGLENDITCKLRLNDQQRRDAKKLKVIRTTGHTEYPAVTRWDRDKDGKYYITMKCGDGWCDVGLVDALRGSAALAVDGLAPAERAVRSIKGWYDQQTLAVPAGVDKVRPQKIVGTVIPAPGLTAFAFARGVEERVATIEIGNLEQYQSKLGLEAGRNDLYLVRNGPTDNDWVAYMGPPGDPNRKRLYVKRHDHTGQGFTIPGTTRWRWLAKDETIWVRCLYGCCQVQEDDPNAVVSSTVPAAGTAGRH
jgi:hypothetical protein